MGIMKKLTKLMAAVLMAVMLTGILPVAAHAAGREAKVTSYMLNVRAGAAQEYTIIDVAYEGNTMDVLEELPNGWVKVRFNGQEGWVSSLFLSIYDKPEPTASQTYEAAETAVEQAAPAAAQPAPAAAQPAPAATQGANASVKGEGVYFRSGPSMSSSVLDTLSNGTRVRINGVCAAWYEVSYNGQTGYIHGDFVSRDGQTAAQPVTAQTVAAAPETAVAVEIAAPEPVETPAPAATPEPTAAPPKALSASGQAVVDTAMKYQGIPYRWAGTSPESGFDCSGLVYYVYKQHGVTLNRVAQSMAYNGTEVDLNNLQPGDILLFGSSVYNIWHAGIYIGNGQFIHAPHSGAVVSTQSIAGTYGMRLVAARRIF